MLDKPLAIAAVTAGALWADAASAQHQEQAPDIVVTAPIEGSRIESLQGATVLRRDDIIENLSNGLGDTLDSAPGVATTFFGAGASRPIIRGLGEDRVRVLQNGIGAIDASTASPDHAVTSDGLDAERIEILRGAAALAYGGNAVGGVVNVIDQSIPRRAIDGAHVDALAAYSSADQGHHGAANVGFGAGALAVELGAIARETDPYETPVGEALNQFTSLLSYSAGASVVGDWGFAGLAGKRVEDEYGLLPEDASEPGGRIVLEQTRFESRGDVELSAGPLDRLDYGVQHSDYEHTEFEGDGAAGTIFTSEGFEARLEAHHGGERLSGAFGLQYSDVDLAAVGEEAFISATNTRDAGVFLIQRWDVGPSWGLEGGVRLERRELENAGFGTLEFDNLSGSLGLYVRPSEDWFFGATFARVERAPTAIELFSEGPHLATANFERGDPTLQQETASSFELSARRQRGGFSFEANLFGIDFEDYIALVNTDLVWYSDPGAIPDEDIVASDDPILGLLSPDAETLPVFQFVQRDAAFIGGEIAVSQRLGAIGAFDITADAALDIVRAGFDGGGRPPRIPPRTLTLGIGAESERWNARVEFVDTDSQRRVAEFETATDGFSILNASLAFRPGGVGGPWSIRLDGRNLTDAEGRVHTSFLKDELLLPGRNVRLTVAASF